MNICVFDTETINTVKPFCYNVGFVIYDTDNCTVLERKEFVIEQIWHNIPLFSTAYYAEKRPIYIKRMRARKITLEKWGNVCSYMRRAFKNYNVEYAYAYNAPFDDKVFSFNCEHFKTLNPFDNIPIIDIMGLVHKKIAFTKEYQAFCEKYSLFTDSGNYSTTAENVTRYIMQNVDFTEEHTALSDSEIELAILYHCIDLGCEYGQSYTKYLSIKRNVKRYLVIDEKSKNRQTTFEYTSIRISKDKTQITLT